MAKKIPSNFYQEVNVRKLDRVFSNEGDVPTPSVSDEGKVIKVNSEGKYALLPDGGAQTMTVAITYDETTEEYSADKTHAEIVEAIAAGVIVKATYDNLTFVYAGTNKPAAFDGVYFTYIQADSEDQLLCKCFEIDSDNRIVYSFHDISEELPVVDTDDNGKLLGVVNGVWDNVPYYNKCYTIPVIDKDGNFNSMLPLMNIVLSSSSRPTPDANGYYESDCFFGTPTNRKGTTALTLTPEDFDNIIIGLGTQIFISFNINDGTNNLNIRGCGSWNTQAHDSTGAYMDNIAALLEYITYTNFLVDSDKYAMYDCTITRVNDKYHIKFKLEKITVS